MANLLSELKDKLEKKEHLIDQLGEALEWYMKCELEGFSLTNDPFPAANAALIAWERDKQNR